MPIFNPEQPTTADLRRVTILAFLSRFTDEEAIAIDLNSMGVTLDAAKLRRFLDKVKAATFIDLSRDDTVAGVNALEAIGLIKPGRASEILTAPIQSFEIPKL